jgi:hypothetical protein
VQQDRYCRSCGQELQPEDRFCAGCGRPVHATAQVPTPEADVPVPPPPKQAEAIAQPTQATEQTAAPSPQLQQRPLWRWSQYKWKIFFFLGCVIFVSVLEAVADPASAEGSLAESVGFVIGFASASSLSYLLIFIPIWLALGGLAYLVARLLGQKTPFFRMVFDWWVTLVVVIPILLVGWPSP